VAGKVRWIGSARDDLRRFPQEVRRVVAYALWLAESGDKHPDAKPLHGFSGAGVLEMVEDHDGKTYRAVYTVKFEGVIYVLHAFQKKSHKGIATPKSDMDLIKLRLRQAEDDHRSTKK
jgi:phage-related protein